MVGIAGFVEIYRNLTEMIWTFWTLTFANNVNIARRQD
jgi:hypothetical protein